MQEGRGSFAAMILSLCKGRADKHITESKARWASRLGIEEGKDIAKERHSILPACSI